MINLDYINENEHRRYIRKPINVTADTDNSPLVLIKNIGIGGLCCITKTPLELHKKYTFNFKLPGDGSIMTKGIVKWFRITPSLSYENGIEYVELNNTNFLLNINNHIKNSLTITR